MCVYNGMNDKHSNRLTIGKIYKVLEMPSQDIIFIKDDVGDEVSYVMISGEHVWFKDATAYTREEKLKELGI